MKYDFWSVAVWGIVFLIGLAVVVTFVVLGIFFIDWIDGI